MTNRKQTFTPDVRKSGYLKIGRNQLKALFTNDQEQQRLAKALLCVQTFAFFSEGKVTMREGDILCRPGEWITSYTEISRLTGINRCSVRYCMEKLMEMGFLTVENFLGYKRISLNNYSQQMLIAHNPSFGGNMETATEKPIGLFQSASNLYSPSQSVGEA